MSIEDIPCELWLDILDYLNTQEQFNGFFNLNKRINQLLINYHCYISLKNNDENSQYVFQHVLPQFSHPECISSLRLENTNKMNLFKNNHLFHFPHLISLTLCNLPISNDTLDFLRYHASHLQYLNASSHISSNWNRLLQLILSLPKLHTCYLQLGIGLCPMKTQPSSTSSIKHLTLLGLYQTCCMNNLISLLNYLPHLNSLRLHCNRLKFAEILQEQSTNKSLSLSSFYLKINHLPELFIDFIYFISTTMRNLEKLKIKCCNPLLDLVYVNVYQWIKLIDILTNLKELTLIVTPKKTIEEKSWNQRCEQLMKLMNMRHITLRIIKPKE